MSLILIALLAASPEVKLAAPVFSAVNVDDKTANFYTEYFSEQLSRGGVRVTTQAEINALIGLERQKMLLGCSVDDSSSCMAELAGALGVDGVVAGTLARLGTGYSATLKVVAVEGNAVIAQASFRAKDDDELHEKLSQTARQFGPKVIAWKTPASDAAVSREGGGGGLRSKAWIPFAAAGALGAGAVATYVMASSEYQWAQANPGAEQTVAEPRLRNGATMQNVARGLTAAAVVAAAVGAGFFAFGGEPAVEASAVLTPNGAAVAITGVFP